MGVWFIERLPLCHQGGWITLLSANPPEMMKNAYFHNLIYTKHKQGLSEEGGPAFAFTMQIY
jgi:hypothetical protein